MTIRTWSPNRRASILTLFCDRCNQVFHPPTIEYTACGDCHDGVRYAGPSLSSAEVLAAAKKAQATKPHHKPPRRRHP